MSSILGVPGTTAAENTWYLPEVHGGLGSTITLFNPGSEPVTATIHTALTGGSGPWLLRSVPAHTEVRVPVSSITSAREVSVEVDATAPVVAGSEWQDGAPLPVASVGCVETANSWSIIGGLGGGATSDSISIYNPSAQVANATFRVLPAHGAWSTWSIVVAGHGRYARSLIGVEPSGGAIIAVTTSRPVAIAHTIASGSGTAVAPAAIVTGSQ